MKPAALFSPSWLALASVLVLAVRPVSAQEGEEIDSLDSTQSSESNEAVAPLLEGMGDHHHAVSTHSQRAQRFFDQGLVLLFGFNHAEAVRSFQEAARVDPDCAMAYWGIALALGPNINQPMPDEAVPQAYEALQKAKSLASEASPREQAYIDALSERYVAEPMEDRSSLDLAYADAMRELADQYPDDLDAATLFAEALMDTMPWDYWTPGLEPRPATKEVLATLESVLERNPSHPGANHYYIHAVEAGPNPEKGIPAADRLRDLVPGAGHLVHMPSHIYLRVGQYHAASKANERAVAADESYIAQCRQQGYYPALYYPHNIHFLWYTTGMEGRSRDSLEAARYVVAQIKNEVEEAVEEPRLLSLPIQTLTRFGRWEAVLNEPEPPAGNVFETAMWHYARGVAQAALEDEEAARQELTALQAIARSPESRELDTPFFPGTQLIDIAIHVLEGKIAEQQGQVDQAITHFRGAVELQDDLPYMEPPYWYYPVRQSLGSTLMKAGRHSEAEAVFRTGLTHFPHNGWDLYGLTQSLQAQGKTTEARRTEERFKKAWQNADCDLNFSMY